MTLKNFQCQSSKLVDNQVKYRYTDSKTTLKKIDNVVFNVVIQVLVLQESNFKMTLKN